MTFHVICSSEGRVFKIEVIAESAEEAREKVRKMAKQHGVKHLHITAILQIKL